MAKERENRIDLLRGISLLLIFIGHSNFSFSEGFQQSRGFSDASELFVLLAGVSAALAYYRPSKPGDDWQFARPLRRALKLYAVHLLLLFAMICLAGLALFASPRVQAVVRTGLDVSQFWDAPIAHGIDALLLAWMPGNLDILPMYVVLIALVPLIFRAYDRAKYALFAVSGLVWLVAGLGHINLANRAADPGHWYFDPLSWQVIFIAGIVVGIRIKTGKPVLPYNRMLFAAAAAFALIAIPTNLLFHFHIVEPPMPGLYQALISKTNSGFLRLVNVLSILYLAWNIKAVAWAAAHPAFRPLSTAGRHSLPVFVLGIVLSDLMLATMLVRPQLAVPIQIVLAVAGCLVHLVLADWLEQTKKRRTAGVDAKRDVPRPAQPKPAAYGSLLQLAAPATVAG